MDRYSPTAHNMMEYIDKVYVINMRKDVERMKNFTAMMNRLRIPFERVEAVDGRTAYLDPNIVDLETLTDSEGGLIMSHVSIWFKVLNEGYNRVLVFEDDANTHIDRQLLDEKITKVFESTRAKPPELVFIGSCLDHCEKRKHIVDDIYQTFRAWCAHALVLTRRAIEKLIPKLPFTTAYDIYIAQFIESGYLTAYTFSKSIFFQDTNFASNLRGKRQALETNVECNEVVKSQDEDFLRVTVVSVCSLFLIAILTVVIVMVIVYFRDRERRR